MSDADLVQRCLEKDQAAWGDLVQKYRTLVYSIPKRHGLTDAMCDDVFQNVFLALVRSLESFRDGQSLAKWLMTTTQRECWRAIKASRRDPTCLAGTNVELVEGVDPSQETRARWERQNILRVAIERLGGLCERLLRAAFLDPARPSYAEIASRLGISEGSVGPTRARCMAKLAELVREIDS